MSIVIIFIESHHFTNTFLNLSFFPETNIAAMKMMVRNWLPLQHFTIADTFEGLMRNEPFIALIELIYSASNLLMLTPGIFINSIWSSNGGQYEMNFDIRVDKQQTFEPL